ncbi:MAG: FAD-dependent oxidoreductase [Candidatus Marinimicrobia bacterium]|nr:FAD-dependent oxidoreductase [Candidatus Neomarinimicrobiota bacterium]
MVVGAGIAGICAAVRAARAGLSVCLVESFPYVGGMATGGMVSPFMKYHVKGIPLVKGIFSEIQDIMRSNGKMIDNGFSAEAFRFASEKLLEKAGVEVLTDHCCISVRRESEYIKDITIERKGKRKSLSASFFIDTSGDAVIAHLARLPLAVSAKQQAMTLFFRMRNIDFQRAVAEVRRFPDNFFPWSSKTVHPGHILSVAGYYEQVRLAQMKDEFPKDVSYIFYTSLPEPGTASFNCVNLRGYNGADTTDIIRAREEGLSQIRAIEKLLIRSASGFENTEVDKIADRVGVRETRRAIGEYVMNGNDIRSCRKFPDAVARGCYGIDIHGQEDEKNVMEDIPEGEYYEIPARTLIMKGMKNLLTAGRCLSSTREGQAALRIMPTCAATGEAAGKMAAEAHITGKGLREICKV